MKREIRLKYELDEVTYTYYPNTEPQAGKLPVQGQVGRHNWTMS